PSTTVGTGPGTTTGTRTARSADGRGEDPDRPRAAVPGPRERRGDLRHDRGHGRDRRDRQVLGARGGAVADRRHPVRVLAGPRVRPRPGPPPPGGEAAGLVGGEGRHGRGVGAAAGPGPAAAAAEPGRTRGAGGAAGDPAGPLAGRGRAGHLGHPLRPPPELAMAHGADRRRRQRTVRPGHRDPGGGGALSGGAAPAATSTGSSTGRRSRNSMMARTTSRARVSPRTTLPVGRPQNTRTSAARVTEPMRRARWVGYARAPTRPVENPARPWSQAMARARLSRVRTAVTDWPVRNAPAATTRARTRMVRSPRRRNRTMVSYRTAAASWGSTPAGTASR